MESTSKQKQTAESLLQSFQSNSQRNTAATPRPASMSSQPATPGCQTDAARTSQSQQKKGSSTVTTPKTSEGTAKPDKRPRTPFIDNSSSDENDAGGKSRNGNLPAKRQRAAVTASTGPAAASKPRDSATKKPAEQTSSSQQGPDSPLFFPERDNASQSKPARPTSTTTTASSPTKSTSQNVSKAASSTLGSRQNIVRRMSTEHKRVAGDLTQKHSAFLKCIPAESKSYFEAKLDDIEKEVLALHEQKVDAVKKEYIEKLRQDMDECQKMIGILQKTE